MWLENLNKLKKNSGMTIEQIALSSGVPKGTLNKLFAGQTKDPQLSTVSAVVHCMGYTLDDLSEIPSAVKLTLPPASPRCSRPSISSMRKASRKPWTM